MSTGWHAPIDAYCERASAAFWAEPVNAVTNAAFLIAAALALVLWRQAGGRDWPALGLIGVMTVVGVGSFLFHTVATRWALLADVLPITVFIYSYFALAMTRYLRLDILPTVGATGAFLLASWGFVKAWKAAFGTSALATLNGSIGYLPAALALLAVGSLLMRRAAQAGRAGEGARIAGRALLTAAGVFALSLLFRSIDEATCGVLPIGTHFLWHILNAAVLFILVAAAIRHRALA